MLLKKIIYLYIIKYYKWDYQNRQKKYVEFMRV